MSRGTQGQASGTDRSRDAPIPFVALLALLVLLVPMALPVAGCGHHRVDTVAWPTEIGPTSAVVALPLAEVRSRVWASLDAYGSLERIFAFDRAASDEHYASSFSVEGADDALFGAAILRQPENRNDLYAHTFHEPLWPSPVYRRGEKRLPFIASFHVHLERIDEERTGIEVRAVEAEVLSGKSLGFGSCGLGRHNDYRDVERTTLEESLVLRFLMATLEPPRDRAVLPSRP